MKTFSDLFSTFVILSFDLEGLGALSGVLIVLRRYKWEFNRILTSQIVQSSDFGILWRENAVKTAQNPLYWGRELITELKNLSQRML